MTPMFFPVRWRCAVTPAERGAAQQSAFDGVTAEHAEMLRELNALESLMLQEVKNEDEIMKKWIALI